MKIKFILILLCLHIQIFSQDFGQMYWQMRQRLLDKFIRVGNCHGCGIPASWLKVKEQNANGPIILDELYFSSTL